MSKLFAIVVGIVLTAIGVFLLAGAPFVFSSSAQTPPKPPPLAPLTNIVVDPDGASGWCGQDFIRYHLGRNGNDIRMKVLWFHNDPSPKLNRSLGYAYYDAKWKFKGGAVVPLKGPGGVTSPATFMEEPAGFWRTYLHQTSFTIVDAASAFLGPVTVIVLFRQPNRVCLLRKTFYF